MRKACLMLVAAGLSLAAGGAWSDQTPYRGDGPFILEASDLEWSEVKSMAPGARIAVIEGDMSKEEPFTIRLKLPSDYEIDAHVHPAYERVTVLSGTLYFTDGDETDRANATALHPGDVAIMPPETSMFGYTEDDETVIQLHGVGPWGIDYVDPEDDPRE